MTQSIHTPEEELNKLKFYIKESLPFLQEAWDACFDGNKEKLLSAEQRGMAFLFAQFNNIADGDIPNPPNVITTKESQSIVMLTKKKHLEN